MKKWLTLKLKDNKELDIEYGYTIRESQDGETLVFESVHGYDIIRVPQEDILEIIY